MTSSTDRDNRLWRALEHLADTVIIGLLTLVASLPLVTLPAALAAAHATLADTDCGGSSVGRFCAALAVRVRDGALLGIAALAATLIGTIDVMWSLSSPLTPLRTAVLATGVLILLAAFAITFTGAAALADQEHRAARRAQGQSLRRLLRTSALHAAAAPHRVLALALLATLAAMVTTAAPVLAPALMGLVARALRWAPGAAHQMRGVLVAAS